MTIKHVTIGAIIATLLISGIAAAALAIAGNMDCEINEFLNQDGSQIRNVSRSRRYASA